MSRAGAATEPARSLSVWLSGRVGWTAFGRLTERLAWEASEPGGRGPTLLLCELEPLITIGRQGSRTDVLLSDEELRSRRIDIRFVGRGGGAVLHGPGQLCATLVARLEDLGLHRHDVGAYLTRFEAGLVGALGLLRCGARRLGEGTGSGQPGVIGRTGLLAAIGVAVRRGIACHGAFVNMSVDLSVFARVRTLPRGSAAERRDGFPATMGSIEAELRRRVRPQDVRTAIASELALAFGCPRSHVHAGLPAAEWTPARPRLTGERVGWRE